MSDFELLKLLRDEIETSRAETEFPDRGLWREPPVDFITFCKEWINEPLFEGEQERFANEFIGDPTDEKFWSNENFQALLFWGKGSGKGSISAKLITYAGYLLKTMYDPRAYFGLGRTAPIHMINVSYNSRQAKEVFFQGYLIPTVLNCFNPKTKNNFFEECGVDLRVNEGDILSNTIHFERPTGEGEGGISAVSLAGDRGTAEGYSPLLIFVDEISSMQSPAKAEKLVDDLENSARSRFGSFYKLIVASFKQGKNCLMSLMYQDVEERIKNAEEGQTVPVFLSRAATWEVNRMKRRADFEQMYNKAPVKAARAYECLEIDGVDDSLFFKLQDRLEESFLSPHFNPMEGDVITARSDQLKIIEFKDTFRPIPGMNYNIHLDLAKGTQTDMAGLVMTHREGLESLKGDELQQYIEGVIDKDFMVKADMILQITPDGQAKEIILDDVRKFVIKLNNLGFRISVTLDGFQSLDFIQQLNAKGIPAEMLSVDRNRKAYDSLQSLIYRRCLQLYSHPILLRELKELEESEDGRKVDHPFKSVHRAKYEDGHNAGSKDIADALAGSVVQSVMAPAPNVPIMPSKGMTANRHDEFNRDTANFNRQTHGKKTIPVDKHGNPAEEWKPLMPSRR